MEKYSVSLSIQSVCGKIRTRITPNMDTFHAVLVAYHVCLYIRFEKKLQINQQLVTLFHLLINNQSHFFIFQRFVSPKVIRTYKLRHEFPNYSSSGSQEITNFQESLEIRCRTYDRVHLPKTKTDNSSEKLKKGLLKHPSDFHVNQCVILCERLYSLLRTLQLYYAAANFFSNVLPNSRLKVQ